MKYPWYSEYIDVKKIIPQSDCNEMGTISKYKNVQYSLFCIKYIGEMLLFALNFENKKKKRTHEILKNQ